jgi:hypothetical protein
MKIKNFQETIKLIKSIMKNYFTGLLKKKKKKTLVGQKKKKNNNILMKKNITKYKEIC